MSDPSTLRQRIRSGETLLGTFLNLGSPMATEICARAGLDWVLIDLEHGAGSEAELLSQLTAVAAAGTTAIVRVERSERMRIARALDLGAEGIMAPRVDTADEAAELVRHLRYPPGGIRGVALMTRGAEYGTVAHGEVAAVNDRLVTIAQVESPTAVANAAELAAVDGVDVLFVGPTDLTHAMGIPGEIDHPDYRRAVAEVGQAAAAAGKAAGVLLWRVEDMDAYLDAGYRFLAVGSDGAFVAGGVRSMAAAFRSRTRS